MPANINTYIGREPAWHALGTVTGKYQTWSEILASGGLDYDVFKSQLRDGLGRPVGAWGTFRWDQADKRANLKDRAQFLGVVGEDYKVIDHAKGFEMIDALMSEGEGAAQGAHYETAGVLGHGEVVWGLADLGLRVHVGADETIPYLLFATSHDGSYSYQFRTTATRVVCQNTLSIAIGSRAAAEFKIRHTKSADGRIRGAHQALAAFADETVGVEEKLNFLAGRRMTRESCVVLMDKLFPVRTKQAGTDGEGRVVEVEVNQTRRENVLADILALYESNDDDAFPEQRGSAYAMLNAVTNYTDHARSTRGKDLGRAESALFGSGDRLKTQAMSALMDMGRDMPVLTSMRASMPVSDQDWASVFGPVAGAGAGAR